MISGDCEVWRQFGKVVMKGTFSLDGSFLLIYLSIHGVGICTAKLKEGMTSC